MITRKSPAFLLAVILFLTTGEAFPRGKHAPGERHIYRTVCTLAFGFVGTFAGGSIGNTGGRNYSRNLTTGLFVGMIGGGVGGFFLGRKIDKSMIKSSDPDPQTIKKSQARAVELLLANQDSARPLRAVLGPIPGK